MWDKKWFQECDQKWAQKWKPGWHDSNDTVRKYLIQKGLNFDKASSFQKRLIDIPQVVETNLLHQHNDTPQPALPSSLQKVDEVCSTLKEISVNKVLDSCHLGG